MAHDYVRFRADWITEPGTPTVMMPVGSCCRNERTDGIDEYPRKVQTPTTLSGLSQRESWLLALFYNVQKYL